MPVIETHYSVTEEEYLEAQLLYLGRQQKRFRRMRIVLVVILSLSFLSVFFTKVTIDPTAPGLYIVIPIYLLLLFSPWIEKRNLRRRYVVEQGNFKDVGLRVDERGIHSDVPHVGQADIEWAAYSLLLESPRLYALVRNFTLFLIPKRALSPMQVEEMDWLIGQFLSHAERVKIKK